MSERKKEGGEKEKNTEPEDELNTGKKGGEKDRKKRIEGKGL